VQIPPSAALQRIEESVLRGRIEAALRREGISMETRNDVRDGSQASLDLLYMVMETRDTSGRSIGFAASSCLQVSQMVRIPRLTTPKHIAYAVVSTWQSCGLLVGDSASFRPTLLQNADEHITRFIDAWRFANAPPPHPVLPPSSELLKATSARYLLAAFGPDRLVDDITPQDIARYTELRKRGTGWPDGRKTAKVRTRAVQADLVLLRTMIHWAMTVKSPNGDWLIEENPLRGLSIARECNPEEPGTPSNDA
jgi:hypothetical protein